jgi:type I restriction enzyme S subunit
MAELIRYRKQFIYIDDFKTYKRCRVQLNMNGIVLRDQVSGSEIKTKRQQICKAGDFLVAEIDAKVGGFGIVPEALAGAIVSSHYFLFDINDNLIDRDYLRFFSQTSDFLEQVVAQGSTNYAAIRPDHVLGYTIPLPPVAEQQRVVARIEALAGKIEEVRHLVGESREEIERLTVSMHLNLSMGRQVRLSEVLHLYEEQTAVEVGCAYPQVGVKGFGQGLFPKEAVTAGETTYRYFNRLYPGAIVLSQVKGWEGAIGVCPEELEGWYSSPEYRTFKCLVGQADPQYLSFIFKSAWFLPFVQEATRGVGARRERTRPEQFLNIRLPMPPLDKQIYAVRILKKCEEVLRVRASLALELETLLPSVLDRAFRGEL